MKLYYSPGACSLSPHIALREAGIDFDLIKVDIATHKTEDGLDFYAINPKGYVPVLVLDSGEILTEGPVIAQYIADQAPQAGLAPANGTIERYQLQSTLGYINSEIHKTYGQLFNSNLPAEYRKTVEEKLHAKYAYLEKILTEKDYLMGDIFTIADTYFFTTLNWASHVKVDISAYPNILAYHAKIGVRPTTIAAMRSEGLIA